jgi:hypothetical protein
MNLTLTLRPDLEERLREKAAHEGVLPEVCAVTLLEDQLADKPPAEMRESELLLEAARGLPEEVWQRYQELSRRLREQERLGDDDHREFLQLNELVETTHARRMNYVTELAVRRGQDLRELMDHLGFPKHGRA